MKIVMQALSASLLGLVFFGVALFLPAWTFHYWQAWVFIAVFTASTLGPTVYLAVVDPAALARRMHAGPAAETRPMQRVIMSVTLLSVVALLVVSALDHRFGWSSVPLGVIALGNVLVAVGLLFTQLVVIQNRYAAATITVEAEQPLISTGLYGTVRHPMYAGGLVMMLGTPLALDSYWGLAVLVPGLIAFAARILDEEKVLTEQLAGYRDYLERVPYRLVPYVW